MENKTTEKLVADAAVAADDLAERILCVADAADAMLSSGLTKRAIVLLIKGHTGMAQIDIVNVLDALPRLREYIKSED